MICILFNFKKLIVYFAQNIDMKHYNFKTSGNILAYGWFMDYILKHKWQM